MHDPYYSVPHHNLFKPITVLSWIMPDKKLTAALMDTGDVYIDPKFEERYRFLLGEKYDDFMEYSLRPLNKAIRINTLKTDVEYVKSRLSSWDLKPVPWCKEGFWIEAKRHDRFDIGNLIEHSLGYIYIQDPASMIPPVVLDPKPGERVLDMCAAPGSKTTQIAQYMKNEGILVANDNVPERLKALEINIRRIGAYNTIVTYMQGSHLRKIVDDGILFDKILLDAPCSGSGTIRKSYRSIQKYSYNFVRSMSSTQKRLISAAFDMLRPGGILVYSTCTIEPEENEEVISYLIDKNADACVQDIEIGLKRSEPFTSLGDKTYNDDVTKCVRIFPQDNDTEGFFVAKIEKVSN